MAARLSMLFNQFSSILVLLVYPFPLPYSWDSMEYSVGLVKTALLVCLLCLLRLFAFDDLTR